MICNFRKPSIFKGQISKNFKVARDEMYFFSVLSPFTLCTHIWATVTFQFQTFVHQIYSHRAFFFFWGHIFNTKAIVQN